MDHPRVGGEKMQDINNKLAALGSPPIFTPAWAGKSLFCFTAAVPIQDHPRMGGEKGG